MAPLLRDRCDQDGLGNVKYLLRLLFREVLLMYSKVYFLDWFLYYLVACVPVERKRRKIVLFTHSNEFVIFASVVRRRSITPSREFWWSAIELLWPRVATLNASRARATAPNSRSLPTGFCSNYTVYAYKNGCANGIGSSSSVRFQKLPKLLNPKLLPN